MTSFDSADSPSPASHLSRFKRLQAHPDYPAIRAFLAIYIAAFILNPTASQRQWVLTAYPTTGWRRLLTLSVGKMEVLYVYEDDTVDGGRMPIVRLNVLDGHSVRAGLDELVLSNAGLTYTGAPPGYASRPVLRIEADSFEGAFNTLSSDLVCDEVAELVESLLADEYETYGRYHNQEFADDVLAAISEGNIM